MTGPIEIPARRLAAAEVLARSELRSFRDDTIHLGGITFGRPVVQAVTARGDRTVALLEFPFDLDEPPGSHRYADVSYRVGLVTPGALALDVWPALVETPADAERARTFGVRDDLTFGESGDGRTFRYIAALPRVGATGRGGPSCSWTFRPFADAPLATDGYRVFAVVSAPSPVFQIDGNLAADSTLTRGRLRRDGADFAIAEATPFDVPVGLPFGELVAEGEGKGRHYDDGWDDRTERDAGREAWQTSRRGSTDSPSRDLRNG